MNKKIIEYKLIGIEAERVGDFEIFQNKVNKAIKDGYEVKGDIQISHSQYHTDIIQVVVKYEDKSEVSPWPQFGKVINTSSTPIDTYYKDVKLDKLKNKGFVGDAEPLDGPQSTSGTKTRK